MSSNHEPPKFDPVWGAWVLLLVVLTALIANSIVFVVACMFTGKFCERPGQLANLGTDLIAAIAILVAQRK
jgi:hypothetical protein